MTTESFLTDAFARRLLGRAEQSTAVIPASYYNEDGDCIEIRLSDESFFADRADSLVTFFIGRESRQVVGAVIKGWKQLMESMLEHTPGFRVEIMDDDGVKVEHILSVVLWQKAGSPYDECIVKKYKYLRDAAEANHLRVDLRELQAAY